MNIKTLKKHSFILLVTIIIVCWATLAIFNFTNNLSSSQKKLTNTDMSYVADCNAAQVRFTFERYLKTIESMTVAIKNFDNPTSTEALNMLNKIAKNDIFVRLAVDTIDGMTYTSDGHVRDMTKMGYNHKISYGKPFILDVVNALVDNTPTISLIVPFQNADKTYTYAVRGTINTSTLTDTFTQTFATAGGYYHVIDGNGEYVSSGSSSNALLMDENYFDAIEKLTFADGFSGEYMKEQISEGKSGHMQYAYNGQSRYTYYAPIGINNWFLTMVIPKQVVDKTTNSIMANAFLLMIQIIIIFLLFTAYIYITQKRIRNTALLNEQCFKVLAKQTNKVILEWDFNTNAITALSNFNDLFGRDPVTKNSAFEALDSKAVHKDDQEQFSNIFKTIMQGNSVNDARFRIKDVNNIYHWCSLSGLVINDQKGKPYKAIGSLENINEQIVKEEGLRKKAETDLLTGLYNKTTTEYLIQETFKNSSSRSSKHALFLIDIDNFKDINDRLGHLRGDVVLAQLADLLKSIFRSDDIVGRVGGDEFFVLIKNCHSTELAIKKATEICKSFRKTYTDSNVSVSISSSIGIAFYSENGDNFEDLYKAADIALYNTKANGKNNYSLFSNSDVNNPAHTYQAARTEIDTAGMIQKNFNENRIEYVFKLLYSSDNSTTAIVSTLQLISEQFNFSRVNIFEFNYFDSTASSTFEWCAHSIPSIKNKYQNISFEDLTFAIDLLEKNNGLAAQNISNFPPEHLLKYKSLGIKFLTSFAIMDNDKLMGHIAFQDCVNTDVTRSPLDIDELRTICQVLSTFIIKIKSEQREKEYSFAIETVLDNMEGYAYVVDKETFNVLYENKRVKEVTKTNSVGKPCYSSYMGNQKVCDVCPSRYFTDTSRCYSLNINNVELNIISRTTGTEINWINNKKAYLISSVDISNHGEEKHKS